MNTNEIHFAGATPYDNQIVLKKNDNHYTLDCSCAGYPNTPYGGMGAGGCSYDLPDDFDLSYEFLIDFIKNKTWVKNEFDALSEELYIGELINKGWL